MLLLLQIPVASAGMLCDGTDLDALTKGDHADWTPFLGKWSTERLTNNPNHPGAMELVRFSFSMGPRKSGVLPSGKRTVYRAVEGDSFEYTSYLPRSALRGQTIVDGEPPNQAVFWREGDTLRYVGNSPNAGCIVMTLTRGERPAGSNQKK